MRKTSPLARLAVLVAIPPAFAVTGGVIDERVQLGFTIWRAACRSAGISFTSLVNFTLQLLPGAVIGALLGGLLVQSLAFLMRSRPGHAAECLSAHIGCMFVMPIGLLLCALAMPVPLMVAAEVAIAAVAAAIVLHLRFGTSVVLRI